MGALWVWVGRRGLTGWIWGVLGDDRFGVGEVVDSGWVAGDGCLLRLEAEVACWEGWGDGLTLFRYGGEREEAGSSLHSE
jgi:hypothetical protein